ncbi:fungal specific transcription factor domain-containing protein [Aspergillus puulaauensis]|uniref:Transcription factor domain-containing protein n=1 Tax=Aspergillus puulaauensis TaxID=1220207 RepID=A0A7R7XMK3_9EURO|nr:uncharacterized protein APUU_40371A [Aspergillus puulaauensis]BCS23927.1 hypothetical protein APUU_40371A [Aspergillus puulaauensis]
MQCRSRKKRCYHGSVESVKRAGRAAEDGDTAQQLADVQADESSPHAYSPEFVLEDLSKTHKAVAGGPLAQYNTSAQSSWSLARHQEPDNQDAQNRLVWFNKYRRRPAPSITSTHRKYLEESGAFLELPRSTTDALLPVYNAVLDDIIPVVDGATVLRDHSNGRCSIYLVRAICLVICKTKQAIPFLRLSDNGPVLKPLDFASKLLPGLDAALKADLEPDRLIKIQILALIHLYNDGPSGIERSAAYLSQAIREAWSLSLHLSTPSKPDQAQCDFLWWSLRNFDRLNKPITRSGPFMIDDTDIGLPRIQPGIDNYRSQLMGVSLALGDLMATATKAYKASYTHAADGCEDFPSLDDIVPGTAFTRFHRSHKAYLETWYHASSMLSCRYSGPRSPQYTRRLASADRIVHIITETGNEGLGLPPLPLVPYAVSMATTVVYRAWRDKVRDLHSTYAGLCLCCEALEALSLVWTGARSVASLALGLRGAMDAVEARGSPGIGTDSPRQIDSGIVMDSGEGEPAMRTPVLSYSGQDRDGEREPVHFGDGCDQGDDFWAGLERACLHFDTTFDGFLEYRGFGDFGEFIADEYDIQQGGGGD